ncbi:MAG TPA: class I SAM-dependent methyltransferase [Chthonomonadaceae bacterium]|nr:class I SAM-dependent methyltransferase [Chthonomonadaceae bacterium]
MTDWYDLDAFWEATAPMMFDEKRWAATAAEVDQVLTLLGLEPGTAILDLCCGPGRHSLELARRGYQVTGVDRTAAHLEKARAQAEVEGLNVEFVQEDMRRFCRPEAFGGAINLFTSFGYFEDPADDGQVIANLRRSLKPGGTLVMDIVGKEVLARNFRERFWEEKEGVLLLQEPKISRFWSWIDGRWIVIQGNARREFTVSHRLYSGAELYALLKEYDFRDVEIYGDLSGSPYDHTARRLVAVART